VVDSEEILTIRACADFLKVHPKTLARWKRDGTFPLPCIPVGSRVRYRKRDVLAWLSARERRADS